MEGLLPLSFVLTAAVLVVHSQSADGAHREHKVHNIVLYPDKHSWCITREIKQVISYPGCKSEEIDNNVCVGACFSYSIPHTEPSDPGEVIVPYCDSCQPSDTTWHHVTLQCNKNNHETPPQLVKRVQIINNCSCSSCEKDRFTHPRDLEEGADDLMTQQNDVPDLLKILHNRNETNSISHSEHSENMKAIMNHKIVTLLQNIQEKNSPYDKEQLIDLLKMIQGPEQKLSDKNIADFVESLNSENIQLDLNRLREVLTKFEHSKYFEKHRKTYPDVPTEQMSSSASPNPVNVDVIKPTIDKQDVATIPAHTTTDKNHHHHIGETILGHGHLTKGPNGALVIDPGRIHEKLDVNPHELKPNHAGTLLSYSSHSAEKTKSLEVE